MLKRTGFGIVCLLILLLVNRWVNSATTIQPPKPNERGLENYKLMRGPIHIDTIEDNASGITFNLETNTLFVIQNDPQNIYELTADGKPLRKIELRGFEDTEAITHLWGDQFMFTEERRGNVILATIDQSTRVIDYASVEILNIADDMSNDGFEGISYAPEWHQFILAKEKKPMELILFSGMDGDERILNKSLERRTINNLAVKDISGLQFDSQTHNILVLSDESQELVELSPAGKRISHLKLRGWAPNKYMYPSQPEGVTIDPAGNIYICSEPNLLYIYSRPPTQDNVASK